MVSIDWLQCYDQTIMFSLVHLEWVGVVAFPGDEGFVNLCHTLLSHSCCSREVSLPRSDSCSHFHPLIPLATNVKRCCMTSELHTKSKDFGRLKLCNNSITRSCVILVNSFLVLMSNVKTVIQASIIHVSLWLRL